MVVAGPQLESKAETRVLEHTVAVRPRAWSSLPGAAPAASTAGPSPPARLRAPGPLITVQCTFAHAMARTEGANGSEWERAAPPVSPVREDPGIDRRDERDAAGRSARTGELQLQLPIRLRLSE